MTILGSRADLGIDITSIGLIVGTIGQVLPDIAALMSIIWLAIRIWETCTVLKLTRRIKKEGPCNE